MRFFKNEHLPGICIYKTCKNQVPSLNSSWENQGRTHWAISGARAEVVMGFEREASKSETADPIAAGSKWWMPDTWCSESMAKLAKAGDTFS